MEARHIKLTEILEHNVQYKIPIYQRTYDWQVEHCKQLYEDIIKIGKLEEEHDHFIGAFTYVDETVMANIDVTSYQVIDGQQRLTTIMLLLKALRSLLNKSKHDSKYVTNPKIDQLLFNITQEGSDKYNKLILAEEDNPSFDDILMDKELEESNNIVTNFKNFTTWLDEGDINPDVIWMGIKRLTIVQILIGDKDDAQAIFESMNSTGLDLSETDMIQNYLLMSKDSDWQKEIYEKYWHPMEQSFKGVKKENFDEFLRNYLMMHRGKIVTKKEMYVYFKTHMSTRNIETEIQQIYEYSKHYTNLITITKHPSNKLKIVIDYVHQQETNVPNSLLLKVLSDYHNEIINEEEAESIFLLVDSYLLRCHVCDMNKAGNKVFPEMILKIDPKQYLKSIEKILMSKIGNQRFPRDITIKEKLKQLPLYTNRTMCRYMLSRLEGEKNKERVSLDNLQIEHIMPRTLTKDWKDSLGHNFSEIHEKYLHTIGNLTLTAYNPDLSNAIFSIKQEQYKKSNITITRDLEKYEEWNKEQIEQRINMMTEDMIKIWYCPKEYDSDTPDDAEIENEYLDGKEINSLWDTLKKKVQENCNQVIFNMTRQYGTFRIITNTKNTVICSFEARRSKIYCVYNTKIQQNIITKSKFVKDMSKTGHLGAGDFRSTIMSKEDIDKAIELIKIIYENKLKDN